MLIDTEQANWGCGARRLSASERTLPMEGIGARRSAPKRILIVEDNELNVKLLKDILELHGYTVQVAGHGVAAIDQVRRDQPDLILLDIRLPDIPGTEVAQQLKGDPATRNIPIIAVTAFAMPGDRDKILESGCNDYISKPINIANFLAMVENYTDGTTSDTPLACG